MEELVGGHNPSHKAPPMSKIGEKGGSKGELKGGAMENSMYVRVIEGEEVRGDDPIEHFLPKGVGSTF